MPKVRRLMSNGFVANFVRFPAVQKFWKSVKIWQSYREFKGGNFFWDTVYMLHLCWEMRNEMLLLLFLAWHRRSALFIREDFWREWRRLFLQVQCLQPVSWPDYNWIVLRSTRHSQSVLLHVWKCWLTALL